jgi:hypothetical protein
MNTLHRLQKLYALVKKIDEARLGNDWETKRQFEMIRKSAIEQIKLIEKELHNNNINNNTDMVK